MIYKYHNPSCLEGQRQLLFQLRRKSRSKHAAASRPLRYSKCSICTSRAAGTLGHDMCRLHNPGQDTDTSCDRHYKTYEVSRIWHLCFFCDIVCFPFSPSRSESRKRAIRNLQLDQSSSDDELFLSASIRKGVNLCA